jgi:type II secretory pathway predicted ATPase ExeA
MDVTQFGLRRRPFRAAPDLEAYYPSSTHEAALTQVREAIESEQGIVLLTGEPGTGKTLLTRRLLETIAEHVRPILITNSLFSNRKDLLQAILFELGLPYENATEQTARLLAIDSCLKHYNDGGSTLIVIDEAHELSVELLEELRQFSNLDGKDGKAAQVLLVGLPAIEAKFQDARLTVLRQRLQTRGRIEPLGIDESADYLIHQARVCGGKPDRLFGDDVLDIFCHAAGGIPRVLNQAASLALQLAKENGTDFVDTEAAVEAITQLGLDPIHEGEMIEEDRERPESIRIKPADILLAPKIIDSRIDMRVGETKYLDPMDTPSRPTTLPFAPVILPIADGPPTFIYGHELVDGMDVIGPQRPAGHRDLWKPSDQVG